MRSTFISIIYHRRQRSLATYVCISIEESAVDDPKRDGPYLLQLDTVYGSVRAHPPAHPALLSPIWNSTQVLYLNASSSQQSCDYLGNRAGRMCVGASIPIYSRASGLGIVSESVYSSRYILNTGVPTILPRRTPAPRC